MGETTTLVVKIRYVRDEIGEIVHKREAKKQTEDEMKEALFAKILSKMNTDISMSIKLYRELVYIDERTYEYVLTAYLQED